jgi:hypothetical protein
MVEVLAGCFVLPKDVSSTYTARNTQRVLESRYWYQSGIEPEVADLAAENENPNFRIDSDSFTRTNLTLNRNSTQGKRRKEDQDGEYLLQLESLPIGGIEIVLPHQPPG